ncbi:MAG TPA: response regulator [Azospirillaceae bacterium]|nr:response regulator [Azospirillaceae bacterium]
MGEYNFSAVEVLIIDPQIHTRRIIRTALNHIDVKTITEFDSPQSMMEKMEGGASAGMPDLLIIDADAPDSPNFKFLNQVRHGHVLRNPFLGIVVSTWNPTNLMLARATNAGADDLMAKPVSIKQVEDRLIALVEQRRPFVVTSDYIGPDRRRQSRDNPRLASSMDPPNTVRLKAVNQFGQVDLQAELAESFDLINQHKLVGHAFQVAFLVEYALPGLVGKQPDPMAMEHVQRVPAIIEDFLRRIRDPELRVATDRIATALNEHIDNIVHPEGRAPERLASLRLAAMQLMRAINPDRQVKDMEADVKAAVQTYRTRLKEILASRMAASALADETAPIAASIP